MQLLNRVQQFRWMSHAVSQFRLESRDIAEYASHLSGPWDLEYEQLEGGAAVHSIEGVVAGRDAVYVERSTRTVGVRGCIEPGTVLISSPSQRSRQGRFWCSALDGDCLVVITSGREVDVAVPTCDNVEVTMDEASLRSHFEQVAGEDAEFLDGTSPFLRMAPGILGAIEKTLRHLASDRTPIPPGYSISKEVARLLAKGVRAGNDPIRVSSRQNRRVRDCIALWEESDFDLGVSAICQLAGVSERTLGIWFKARCNLSPYQYLQRRRLNLAHRDLLATDPAVGTVTEIAMRYGFHELGRFAGLYREFFGEPPSRTLSRRSGKSAEGMGKRAARQSDQVGEV